MFKNLKVEDALAYLDRVKLALVDKSEMYSTFLDILSEFKSQKISTRGVVCRIKEVFKEYPDLLMGFNAFMPIDCKIELNEISKENNISSKMNGEDKTHPIIAVATVHHENGLYNVENERETDQNLIYDFCINFLNKVKKRFASDPVVYNNFFIFIHRLLSEKRDPQDVENVKVYTVVKRLFDSEPDLVLETLEILPKMFSLGDFLTNYIELSMDVSQFASYECFFDDASTSTLELPMNINVTTTHRKRTLNDLLPLTPNKIRRVDENLDDYRKYSDEIGLNGSYEEYLFFDKVRKALNDEEVYRNFLRCLFLYNQDLITKTELMQLLTPFFGKFPDLVKWLRQFLNCDEFVGYIEILNPNDFPSAKRPDEINVEIDYASCKRYGVSYRELPKNVTLPKCSGRNALCNEVLNNTCVSFPSWQSEDSSVVSSKKTQHEECIYRTEDERFELDIVIEVNKAAILALEVVHKRMNRMNVNDAKRFQLDSLLGGRSQAIQQRSIKRVYGDKATDIIDGLTRNPFVAVPLVLNRLKAKEKEWKEAQISFNRVWREQNEKAYWKSLDQQGNYFKQNDLKLIRSKTLINQIEVLFDERRQALEQSLFCNRNEGPLMQVVYPNDRTVFSDANDILLHSVQRQTSFHKNDNSKIKKFLKEMFPTLLGAEIEPIFEIDEEKFLADNCDDATNNVVVTSRGRVVSKKRPAKIRGGVKKLRSSVSADQSSNDSSTVLIANGKEKPETKDSYGCSLMFVPESWYIFIRLHHILVERLAKLKSRADTLIRCEKFGVENTSLSNENYKSRNKTGLLQTKDSYWTFIRQIKNLLEGEIDTNQYEDILHDLFGAECYLAFTFDKIVQNCVKQLHAIVNDEVSTKTQVLFNRWRSIKCFTQSAQKSADVNYAKEAETIFDGQTRFKTFFYEEGKVSFELLPVSSSTEQRKTNEEDFRESHRWSNFVETFVDVDGLMRPTTSVHLPSKPVHLKRNLKRMKNKTERDDASSSKGSDSCSLTNDNEKNLIIREDLQALLTNRRNRSLYYVAGTFDYMYRIGSLKKSRDTFLRCADNRNRRFCDWHERWLILNVSLNEARSVADWFVEGKLDEVSLNNAIKIHRSTDPCPRRPPFCVMSRYLSMTNVRKSPSSISKMT